MMDIKSLTLQELESELLQIGEKKFRGKQIFTWLHQQKVLSFEEMTNISKDLQQKLARNFEITKFTELD
ncbi:MAG: 23S rRNA (adenine(2503)-C(2))-methyltransferase RlmN, partial [Vallitaleaceae bacterium]|nr:23S rRNA (adenine(2503)-C(2))-methyltransferase RlmN [Vallitaleaceae bacterium]